MLKDDIKSERSESLDKLRLLANDDSWIEAQIEEIKFMVYGIHWWNWHRLC